MEKGEVVLVGCSSQSLSTGRKERTNGVILDRTRRIRAQGRIILRHSDSGRSESPGRLGKLGREI